MIDSISETVLRASSGSGIPWPVLIAGLAFIESMFGIGLFISGILLFSTAVLIHSQGLISLPVLALAGFLGALAGDICGYTLGRIGGPGIRSLGWINKRRATLSRIDHWLQRGAPFAICVGRLVPALRSLMPAIAGVSGLRASRFLMYDLLACSLWMVGLVVLVTATNAAFRLA